MKTKVILATLLASLLGCKDSSESTGESNLAASVREKGGVNTVLIHQNLVDAPRECLYNLANVYSDAIADGLAVNGARMDLGFNAPVGKKMDTEGFYFQLVRIFSYFDWEMGRQLRLEVGDKCLPENVTFGVATLPSTYASRLPKPFGEDLDKFEKAFGILAPDWDTPKFGQLPAGRFPFEWPGGAAMPSDFTEAVRTSLLGKLEYVRQTMAAPGNTTEKLQAILKGSEPAAAFMDAHFPPGNPSASELKVTAFLPPFQELKTPNEDDVNSWTLAPGLSRHDLPRQVDISVAKLTQIGYLTDPEPSRTPVIRVELEKKFSEPDIVRTKVRFGQLSSGTGDILALDVRDPRNALYIGFYPNLAIKPTDNAVVRKAKEEFNTVANRYKVDARIHQLNLTLQRPSRNSVAAYDQNDEPLRPYFSFKDSDISFRIHRYTGDGFEQTALKAVGFTCEAQAEAKEKHCFADFGAYTDLANFVDGEETQPSRGLGTLAGLGKRALNAALRLNTKIVVDYNIRAIEDALDQQFVQIIEDAMDEQDAVKAKVQKRLTKALSTP